MRQQYQGNPESAAHVTIVGGGLAGSEAAWQAAEMGAAVTLYEMRPQRTTPAHTTEKLCELVCSNSFGSESEGSASFLLKSELDRLGAFVLRCARESRVAAGASLAVDRDVFADKVTAALANHPNITIRREELSHIPQDRITVLATGPLTSEALASDLCRYLGSESLYFYDAISPIVSTDSLDLDQMFYANRYDKGDTADFLNIPLTKDQYFEFIDALLKGDVVLPHNFEKEKYFEGCMPIEAIAARGPMTLAFGPMKPVGLTDPKTGRWPYAAIQLRAENRYRTAYNLVGFQTKLKYGEQSRIFRTLPGLASAEFLRLGSMHRNTYVNSPKELTPTLRLRALEQTFLAGQLTGTEGYLESSATGWLAGQNAARLALGRPLLQLPTTTMLGALVATITDPEREKFQPMNSHFGVLPPLEGPKIKDKRLRNDAYCSRSEGALQQWLERISKIPS